jgi:hypothetical protein
MRGAPLRFVVAALALIVLVTGFIALRYRSTRAPSHVATFADATHRESPSSDARTDTTLAAPSRDAIARDPESAARDWHAFALRVIAAKRKRALGDEVGALMSLPYDQAMPALRSRALDGDGAAASAIAEIVLTCRAEAARRAGRPSTHSNAAARWPHLSPAWATFADRLDADFWSAHEARTDHCPDDSGFVDFVLQLMDRYLRSDNVEARIDIAADNTDKAQAIADLRALVADGAGARAEYLLADRLLTEPDAASQTDGIAIFERLAADDPVSALRLGDCFAKGCDGFKARPDEAIPWIEEAAGNGEFSAYTLLLPRLDADGDAAAAWAWSLYRLDLALDGCFESTEPEAFRIGEAANDEARRRATLGSADQNAGLARYYEISGRWEKRARERLDCAD